MFMRRVLGRRELPVISISAPQGDIEARLPRGGWLRLYFLAIREKCWNGYQALADDPAERACMASEGGRSLCGVAISDGLRIPSIWWRQA